VDKEIRTLPITLTVEQRAEGEGKKIVGHAAVFNSLSEDFGGWREQIAPGAFKKAIKTDDVRALFNHDANYVIGRNKAGTLRMAEDDTGLSIEIDPPDTQWARDLVTSMERGDINQMSFGFSVDRDGQKWDESEDGDVRTIKKVSRLYDVSPVTFPAYTQTDAAMREFRNFCETRRKPTVPLSVLEREVDLKELES
jgi:HK97 family phage prohead protease